VELESKGYAEIATGWDEGERRPYVYANITNAGRTRISEGLSPDDREET
jgi:hypothetical protein